MQENLPLLRDIHLPPPVSPFPLGYGWGLLLLAVLLLIGTYFFAKYIRTKSRKYYALRMLSAASANNLQSARQISEILRRVCLYKYKNAVSLFGRDWIDFLNSRVSHKISPSAADLLLYAPYMPEKKEYSAQAYQNLRQFAKRWIGENL